MKKLIVSLAFIAVGVLSSSTARAQGYGTAGCGVGSILFGNQPGFVQILAATTNGIFGNQTFGITTGTLNCGSGMGPMVATAAFVESNREVLAKDIARGGGETIDALTTVAGCRDPRSVGKALRSQYGAIFPSAEVTNIEVSGTVVSILRKNRSLGCTKLVSKTAKRSRARATAVANR